MSGIIRSRGLTVDLLNGKRYRFHSSFMDMSAEIGNNTLYIKCNRGKHVYHTMIPLSSVLRFDWVLPEQPKEGNME